MLFSAVHVRHKAMRACSAAFSAFCEGALLRLSSSEISDSRSDAGKHASKVLISALICSVPPSRFKRAMRYEAAMVSRSASSARNVPW